jgi:hypothetical protein
MDHADHLNVWEANGIGHVAAVSKGLTPDPSAEANARLIAAAPDLLESLMASPIQEHEPNPNDDGCPCICCGCGFVRKARAAIAKATGKEIA